MTNTTAGDADGQPASDRQVSAEFNDAGFLSVLAEKVLTAWLRHRYQRLFASSLDLNKLEDRHRELLIAAMAAAARADGAIDPAERTRIAKTAALVWGNGGGVAPPAPEQAAPLESVLAESRDMQTAILIYAGALMALDRRRPVNRHFLRYLATRLGLADDFVTGLEQRFRSPR